jgi:hypothetical protein
MPVDGGQLYLFNHNSMIIIKDQLSDNPNLQSYGFENVKKNGCSQKILEALEACLEAIDFVIQDIKSSA